jgi:30S ribosomal protein S31
MGRGDKRTRKGKTFRGSYGKSRPHDSDKKAPHASAAHPAPAPKSGRGK